jgi:hypothetical protein
MKTYLHYRAGPAVIDMIRQEGLNPRKIKVFAGPAGGPKWFVSVGFDKTLIRTRFLEGTDGKTLLAGSSAGGWRCLAMASSDPMDAYERLRIAYSRNIFTAVDTPRTVAMALKGNVDAFIPDKAVEHTVNHDRFDLAVHAVRAKGPSASADRRIEGFAILAAGLMNAVTPKAMNVFYERVVFYSGDPAPVFTSFFNGRAIRLTTRNLRHAALATGSLPYIVAGVENIPDAPMGVYRDGGLTDYQLNQDYHPGPGGITLFFHYQERIVPGWLDKKLRWRRPPKESLDCVLQVYPGRDFLDLLPDRRLPDREDFRIFVDRPSERIERWDKVSELSEILGEQFMEDVQSGTISKSVKPL